MNVLLFLIVCCVIIVQIVNTKNIDLNNNNVLQHRISEAFCWSMCKTPEVTRCDNLKQCNCTDNINHKYSKSWSNGSNFIQAPSISCKDHNLVNFYWRAEENSASFLEVTSVSGDAYFTEVSRCNYYTLKNLSENTTFHLRLWSVFQQRLERSEMVVFSTASRNSSLLPVSSIYLDQLILREDDKYDAILKWTPAEDLSCYYHLVWFGFGEDQLGDYGEKEIRDPTNLHTIRINNLEFETNYSVAIRAKRLDPSKESEAKELYVVTPSCIATYGTLDKCRPPPPKHLTVNEKIIDTTELDTKYDVTLTWTKPDLVPDYYTAHFRNILPDQPNVTGSSITIQGVNTNAIFKNVELGMHYQVVLTAFSKAGSSDPVVQDRYVTGTRAAIISSKQTWTVPELVLVVIGPLSAIFLIIALMVFASHYKAKRDRNEQRCKYFKGLEEKTPEGTDAIVVDLIDVDGPDEWELDPNKLFLQTVLGEGAFGIVRRAYLENNEGDKIEVAIKMLKDSPSPEEVRQFTHEIDIMKSVKRHPHVVSLIGCITRGRPEGPLLVVEYCSRGDLQTYLRTAWDHLTNKQGELQYIDHSSGSSSKCFANRIYDIQNMEFNSEFIIQPKHLISIALQVAMGMEHLARTRVVHRDLAARNVLVCEDRSIKVSDFGLSRDVYQDNVYCKTGGGKLPIRWMALESLTHQRYTTQSDVWSFGVLLWEIVTLGGTPYAGVDSGDLLTLLKNGQRLERPSNCSIELYTIMQNCWKASPKDRPTFTELKKSLDQLLESVSQYLHLDITSQYLYLDPINETNKTKYSLLKSQSGDRHKNSSSVCR